MSQNITNSLNQNPSPNLPTRPTSNLPSRSIRSRNPPSYLKDYHCNFVSKNESQYSLHDYLSYDNLSQKHRVFAMNISANFEPKFYKEASKHKEWCDAMKVELDAMKDNNTWSIVPLPPNKNTVGCKWVYKIKYGSNGQIERHKARLVAKGFNQKEGVNYFETYSPVAKLVTVKLLLALSAIKQWNMVQLDVNNAFLNGDLQEEVFMDIPQGLDIQGEPQGSKLVCKLNKSIYGLKQASRQWFERFSQFMLSSGFVQSKSDYSLFH